MLKHAADVARENAERRSRQQPGPVRPVAPAGPAVIDLDGADDRRRREREKVDKVGRLIDASGVPPRYAEASFRGDYLAGVPSAARASYASAARVVWRLMSEPGIVCLVGGRGPGKTWIACAMVLDLCREGRAARWLHVEDYFEGLKRRYDQKSSVEAYEVNHLRPWLLVLDALENRADTPWEDRQLIRLVTKRHELKLATILISNQDAATFQRRVGDSIVSRTEDDAGAIIVCDWRSLRGGRGGQS